eukprot:1196228-Prorocentrum_minimum.AAC.13
MTVSRKEIRGELNSSVVKRLIKGLTDRFHLRHFSDVREKWGGELNSSVVEWLNKGLMAVSSPSILDFGWSTSTCRLSHLGVSGGATCYEEADRPFELRVGCEVNCNSTYAR